MKWLLIPAVLAMLALCGYLAACSGARRWLSLREWWGGPRRVIWAGARPCPHCDAPPGTAHSSSCPRGVQGSKK